jgi:hypothetical protein
MPASGKLDQIGCSTMQSRQRIGLETLNRGLIWIKWATGFATIFRL